MVRLRLTRMGRRKRPFYRIVAADSRARRDGRHIEILGYYNPMTDPATIKLDLERVDYWVGVGASPSETVVSLIDKARKGGEGIVTDDAGQNLTIEEAPAAEAPAAEAPAAEAAAEEAPAAAADAAGEE